MQYIDVRGVSIPIDECILKDIPYFQSLTSFGSIDYSLDLNPTYVKLYIDVLSIRLLPIGFFWDDIALDRVDTFGAINVADYLGDDDFVERFKLTKTSARFYDSTYKDLVILMDNYPKLVHKLFGAGTISFKFYYESLINYPKDNIPTLDSLIAENAIDVIDDHTSRYYDASSSSNIYVMVMNRIEKGEDIDHSDNRRRYSMIPPKGSGLYWAIMDSDYPVSDTFIEQALRDGEDVPAHRLRQVGLHI